LIHLTFKRELGNLLAQFGYKFDFEKALNLKILTPLPRLAVRIPKEMGLKTGNLMLVIDESDPWASLKLAQALVTADFMKKGRILHKVNERKALKKAFKK
jgi:hypothetical protein